MLQMRVLRGRLAGDRQGRDSECQVPDTGIRQQWGAGPWAMTPGVAIGGEVARFPSLSMCPALDRAGTQPAVPGTGMVDVASGVCLRFARDTLGIGGCGLTLGASGESLAVHEPQGPCNSEKQQQQVWFGVALPSVSLPVVLKTLLPLALGGCRWVLPAQGPKARARQALREPGPGSLFRWPACLSPWSSFSQNKDP